jgi:type I restriction enzyme S subunit
MNWQTQGRVKGKMVGVALIHFNTKSVEDFAIPLFDLKEQVILQSYIEERFSVIDQLNQTIITALQQAEALRQSILKKAFSGQLVPQDPNDEPASVLLERIQAEKAQTNRQVTRQRVKN